MSRCAGAFLCALLALSLYDPILARKSGFSSRSGGSRHSYPSSHSGLSGSGKHGYPSSGGLSGSSHRYPSSGGLSGSSHGYPSSGGLSGSSHGYPSSGGLSGSGNKYPPSGGLSGSGHGYPGSGGLSGSGHSYPSGGISSSGSRYPTGSANTHHTSSHNYPASSGLSGNTGPKTTVNHHYHYHYSPPQQIRYTSSAGVPMHYPVYRGTPPTYVYQYKNSGSKYGTLLAGLALFNLGALSGAAFSHYHHSGSGSSYTPKPGEVCKFGVKKSNGDYEETRIKCDMITSFIWAEEAKQNANKNSTTVTTTTTVTNVTTVNNTNTGAVLPPIPQTNYTMLANGTLVPNETTPVNVTTPLNNGTSSSTITTTTTVTNTTQVADALDVKGPPVQVTPGMECYVIRTTPTSRLKKTVTCGVLQSYAEQSLKRNSAGRSGPTFAVLGAAILAYLIH